ncbi:MAG: translation initiation factor IF-2 [bacterium]|nr:translation initiation factor IF-2 [bacterium]
MNVSELARQLKIHPQKFLQVLPEFGFDIGVRAVKIDDRVAEQIKREWRRIKYVLDEREKKEKEEQKLKEKEARLVSGATVSVPSKLTVRDLADRLGVPVNKLIVELMKNGILANQNENIDRDTAVIVAEELGYKVLEETVKPPTEDNGEHVKNLENILGADKGTSRSPIIVVMGHVDHGKTKLLDSIRHTDVMAGEAGGITQHIGAYQVVWIDPKTKAKKPITFIDTPGHEAFTVMRSRGAKVADIAILVVAADDGVKPQTLEAINIIKAAKLPVVVAINKIDKEGANPERVRTELSQQGIISDEWGGEVPMVEISAKQGLNIEKLLDTLLLVSDVNAEKITANPDRAAAGTVIEAHMDKGEGPVATVLVQAGTLKINDPLVINGEIYGKVRAMRDYRGENLKLAPPSCPARILGFKVAPQVGDVLDVGSAGAAKIIDIKAKRSQQSGAERHTTTAAQKEEAEEKKYYNILIKADTLGSLEAIIGSLDKIKNEEVGIQVVGKGLGNVTGDDVSKAEAGKAIIYAFNVSAITMADQMIRTSGVVFKQYKIIYDLLDDVKAELKKLLNPEVFITELGNFKVVAIFRTDKNTMVLGGRVESGKLIKDCKVRVKRVGEIIGVGKLIQLQTGKQAVNEVPGGTECGVQYEGKLKVEVDDVLEAYKEETKEKKLVLQ